MLSLRDLFHLPQIDPVIQQIKRENEGLVIVAGIDPRAHVQDEMSSPFPASGRAGVFRILIREILEANPDLGATVVIEGREKFRLSRNLYGRVHFERVNKSDDYSSLIPIIAKRRDGLVVIDQLTPENITVVLGIAKEGLRVIVQMDTVYRGVEVARGLLDWGVPRSRLNDLRWVVTLSRIPVLCDCKYPDILDEDLLMMIQRRYPHLRVDRKKTYYKAGGCKDCEQRGRRNEITAFDFLRMGPEMEVEEPNLFPLEAYLLGLAEQGFIPLTDLLRIDSDQLNRTYKLLTTSERALTKAKSTLERKVVELEAANRVLRNRTEELISLQEIGQALIGTTSLRELARHVCRQASVICGADRAIFYFRHGADKVDVLGTHGWEPGRVPSQVQAASICRPDAVGSPTSYRGWPPGVKSRKGDAPLQAGLLVPFVTQGDTVGAMLVHSSTKHRFQPGEVALLQTFANQSALAIQRAGLIENLRDKITQLEDAQAGLAQKERMERELELAREVQQAVLPHSFPRIQGFSFTAKNQPARQVGGDFYDVIDLGAGRFGLVVADVSDKGMPAAVYMALTRSLMVAEARRGDSPREVLENVNALLLELGGGRMFVTVFYGVMDVSSRKLTYTRAGHDKPLLVRHGEVQRLPGEGVFLGYMQSEELHLSEESLEMESGDRLVLFTDGLVDAGSPDGKRLSRDGLVDLLLQYSNLSVMSMGEEVFSSVINFQGTADQYDDMTLLLVGVDSDNPYVEP